MEGKKPQRKMLTTVQKVQLYTLMVKLHDNGKLKEMTHDIICQHANEQLGFPVNYGHVKSILTETGWEVYKLKRNDKVSKVDLIERIKELEARLEDMQAALAVNPKQDSSFPKEWKEWIESLVGSFDRRLKDIERKLNMPVHVPPANTIRAIPTPANLYNKPGMYGKH